VQHTTLPLISKKCKKIEMSDQRLVPANRIYASASQHLELCQHIIYLLNCRPVATSTRLYLLDFLIDLRPSPENAIYRVDVRTYHVLRRVLVQIGEAETVSQRYLLQDLLRWTVDCHRERVSSRVRYWENGRYRRMPGPLGGRRAIWREVTPPVVERRETVHYPAIDGSVRCHRCHRYGMLFHLHCGGLTGRAFDEGLYCCCAVAVSRRTVRILGI
jgi:hypothetical protein